MFRKYGVLGLCMIIFAEMSMFLRVEPFIEWFLPITWFGYILVVDSAVFALKGNSLITSRPKKFIMLFLLSIAFWLIFELYNIFLKGWYYVGVAEPTWLHYAVAFSTILPAVMETFELIKQLHLFDWAKFKIEVPLNKKVLLFITSIGITSLILPIIFPSPYMWVFVWVGIIFLIDPINYILHNEKSLIMQVKKKNFNMIISLFLAGFICGFLWEFWNYWALAKWHYTIPILEEIKIFEIPFLGFFAYGIFACELYVMWQFAKFLFSKRVLGGIAGI